MDLTNSQISEILLNYAHTLEESDDNPYRVRAYRRAAYYIEKWQNNVSVMVRNNEDLTQITGVGERLAAQIKGILQVGRIPFVYPVGVINKKNKHAPYLYELTQLPGIGLKRAKFLYTHFQIQSIAELHAAAASGKLDQLKGFGAQLQKQLQKKYIPKKSTQIRLFHAYKSVNLFINKLTALKKIKKIEVSGEFRRKKELVDEARLLVVLEKNTTLLNFDFTNISAVKKILQLTEAEAYLQLYSGLTIHLNVATASALASTLLFTTGNLAHVEKLQKLAKSKGWLLTEKGLFEKNKRLSGVSENKIYHQLGLQYIPPELRENRGEIQAARRDKLPKLIQLKDIKGNLHTHTNASDGTVSLTDMVQAAYLRGYEYVAITDHSPSLKIARGLSHKELQQQLKAIDKLNTKLDGMVILKSMEIDILEDGGLDLPNWLLKELDITVCSVHSKFRIPEKKQTDRVLRAMDNPYFNILGHATGRLIKSRPPYEINMEKILKKAKENNCILELNAQPYRLDINDEYCLMAKKAGVKIAISSDAHTVAGLDYMQFGVFQAQRGWLEADDVVNTYSLEKLRKVLKK